MWRFRATLVVVTVFALLLFWFAIDLSPAFLPIPKDTIDEWTPRTLTAGVLGALWVHFRIQRGGPAVAVVTLAVSCVLALLLFYCVREPLNQWVEGLLE